MTPAELDAIEARHRTLMDFSAPIGTQWQLATNDIPALVAEVRRLQGAIKAWADEQQRIGWTLPNPTP